MRAEIAGHRQAAFLRLHVPVGVLEAFAVYTVGFVARPIGAAILAITATA
jgi:hypothetical protein